MKYCVLAAAALLATTATAQTTQYTATLAQPLAAEKAIIANGNYWHCSGSTCAITSPPQDPTSLHSCRELRRQVGTLTAYGKKETPFDADKLAKCNATG